MVLNSLSFCLSVKLLISPLYLNEILAGYSNLGCTLFSFISLSMSCHSLLAWRVSIERSAVILMGIPLCVICCFSLAAFNICSLCLIFVKLIIWRRQWHPTPVLLPGKIPWMEEPGRLQSMGLLRVGLDWATSLSRFTSCIVEGNGNPLQCSCLENPRDGGAWWAAVYGVTQSQTRLKQLSSSNTILGLFPRW